MLSNHVKEVLNFVTFPLRIFMFTQGIFGLNSLRDDRFNYVKKEVRGYCLDVGCGEGNLFIKKWLKGKGQGIDVYDYDGKLPKKSVIKDITRFPFKSQVFDSVVFIASINHVPRRNRNQELKETYRCLKKNGNVIITMGNPIAEILIHKLVRVYDFIFGTNYDMDGQRGMVAGEEYYLRDEEIIKRLRAAGFKNISKKFFWTQWFLNHLFIAWKK